MMALFVSLIWLFSKSFVFYSTSSLFVAHVFWKIKFEKSHTLHYINEERQIWNVFYFLFWTQLHSHCYDIQHSKFKPKSQMSDVNSNLWRASTFLIIFLCSPASTFSFFFTYFCKIQSFYESHVWLCQIVFVLLVFTKKLYFGLCRFWQEIERLPCHAKVLSLLLKL